MTNKAIINAAGGDGIFASNFGNGNVSVASAGPITVTGPTAHNDIEAFSAEVGNIFVSTSGNITTVGGSGWEVMKNLILQGGLSMTRLNGNGCEAQSVIHFTPHAERGSTGTWTGGRIILQLHDFRKDSGPAIQQVCLQFVELCRLMGLLTNASVAIDALQSHPGDEHHGHPATDVAIPA